MSAVCTLCECGKHQKAFTKHGYDHFQCNNCQSIYVFPRPSEAELIAFYQLAQTEHLSESCWQDSHKHAWPLWKQTLEIAYKKIGFGKLLDIGCGTGEFIQFAQNLGWQDTEGIEIVPEIAAIAHTKTDSIIHTQILGEAHLKYGKYSVITLWDVIEHLSDVKGNLKEIYNLLKPGGILILGTVNRHGFSIRSLKQNAMTFGPPEHLTFFTKKGTSFALSGQRMKVINQWSSLIYLQEWTRFLGSHKKQNQIPSLESYTEFRSKLTSSTIFLFLVEFINIFLRLTNLGDELIAIAQKEIK
jgi:2-polyprenyl-3-methyl-5-hydroxy-6-metoxy-1,4-benzoquinol methylase